MIISDFVASRDKYRERLSNLPDSPANAHLRTLLAISDADLVDAAVDTYCQQRWGVRPLGTTTSIPASLVAHESSEELFYAVSDILKRSLDRPPVV